MFGLSGSHLIIIGLVVLVFGARRLPELGEGLGKGLKAFKSGLEGKSNNLLSDESQSSDGDSEEKKS